MICSGHVVCASVFVSSAKAGTRDRPGSCEFAHAAFLVFERVSIGVEGYDKSTRHPREVRANRL